MFCLRPTSMGDPTKLSWNSPEVYPWPVVFSDSPRPATQLEGSARPSTSFQLSRKRLRQEKLPLDISILDVVAETPSSSAAMDVDIGSKEDTLQLTSPDRRIHLTGASYRSRRLGLLIHPSPPARNVGRSPLAQPMAPPQCVTHAQRASGVIVSCGPSSNSAANSVAGATHGSSSPPLKRDPRCLVSRVSLLPDAHELIVDWEVDSDQSQ